MGVRKTVFPVFFFFLYFFFFFVYEVLSGLHQLFLSLGSMLSQVKPDLPVFSGAVWLDNWKVSITENLPIFRFANIFLNTNLLVFVCALSLQKIKKWQTCSVQPWVFGGCAAVIEVFVRELSEISGGGGGGGWKQSEGHNFLRQKREGSWKMGR